MRRRGERRGPMEIHEDQDEGVVSIDGYQVYGFIMDIVCRRCGGPLIMNEDYDAEFCPVCNIWLARQCGNPSCVYCPTRPERPMTRPTPAAA